MQIFKYEKALWTCCIVVIRHVLNVEIIALKIYYMKSFSGCYTF